MKDSTDGRVGEWEDAGWMDPMPHPQPHTGNTDMEDRRLRDENTSNGLNAHVKQQQSTSAGPVELRSTKELASVALVKSSHVSPTNATNTESDMGKHRHHERRSGFQTDYTQKSRQCAVFDDKGDLLGVETGVCSDFVWKFLTDYFGTCQIEKDGDWILACPIEFYKELRRTSNKGFTPGPCVFDSTSDYLSAILGKRTHHTDKIYFNNHPLTVEHGTPMVYTARIIQEIVGPYGLRVCRIRANAGHPVEYDLRDWMTYLGCNPIGAEDMQTTNAEFAAMTGQTLEAVNAQYGFEFGTEPLYPSVICEAHKSNQFVNHGVGHASYLPPRGSSQNWWLSLQIDASPWPYAPRPNYEPYQLAEAYDVNFYGIKSAVEAHEEAEKHRKEREARGPQGSHSPTTPAREVQQSR